MKYIFGPINSRRLGVSLGVDLMPFKTCSMDCVYCECGATTDLTIERREYVPTAEVIAELDSYLKNGPSIDVITFSGSGEPTLHSGIGEIITFLKEHYSRYKIVVLTNGSLFWMEDVRKAVLGADIIVPSLDAVTEKGVAEINRPAEGITAAGIVEGLSALRREFSGEIRLEVFIVPGMNDNDSELNALKQACEAIRPDSIQLNTLDRPGTVETVKKASADTIDRITNMLLPLPVEVIGKPDYSREVSPIRGDIDDAVIRTVTRRPSTVEDLARSLDVRPAEVIKILARMIDEGLVEEKVRERGTFYCLKSSDQ
ncbi:MAG TPA: radical SAM protein [Spirochaetota bacterium]|nr:radical SAM protein [Spirochaetota bacterium]